MTATTAQSERDPHGEVRTEIVDDRILVATIDRSDKRNAFTPKILKELAQALTRLDDDPELFVGVILFAGEHSTAGLDMPLFFDTSGGFDLPDGAVDPFGLGRRLTKPRITAVQGITYTAGIELALAGDIVIAASDVRMAQLEPKRGLAPLGGATFRFVQRGGWGNAMYHLLRADEFDAEEAYRIGFVQEIVEAGTQGDRAVELARELLGGSPIAHRLILENARIMIDEGEQAAADAIPALLRTVMESEDLQEGVASFIERRPARFGGR